MKENGTMGKKLIKNAIDQIDTMLASVESTGTAGQTVEMTAEKFVAYAMDQIAKAHREPIAKARIRLAALRKQVKKAATGYQDVESPTMKVDVFVDPGQLIPTEKEQSAASLASGTSGPNKGSTFDGDDPSMTGGTLINAAPGATSFFKNMREVLKALEGEAGGGGGANPGEEEEEEEDETEKAKKKPPVAPGAAPPAVPPGAAPPKKSDDEEDKEKAQKANVAKGLDPEGWPSDLNDPEFVKEGKGKPVDW